jgi:glycosyltransferase involved in cell wall biosynthesis
LKILFHVHRWPPYHGSGGEYHMQEIALWMKERGHEVRIAVRDAERDYDHLGLPVRLRKGGATFEALREDYRWCEIAVTHLDLTRGALMECRKLGRPLVHVVHNQRTLAQYGAQVRDVAIAAFNSEWCRATWLKENRGRFEDVSMIVRPRVRTDVYSGQGGGPALTLINLSDNKGANLFYDLARRNPGRPFIGVLGAYGEQVPAPSLPNLEIRPNGNILPVYHDTRVLLMPSLYESWGRTGLEAGASGIPTLAHPAPGLIESLGSAGTFADRRDVWSWEEAITRFDSPTHYAVIGASAERRAKWQEGLAITELLALEKRMEEAV